MKCQTNDAVNCAGQYRVDLPAIESDCHTLRARFVPMKSRPDEPPLSLYPSSVLPSFPPLSSLQRGAVKHWRPPLLVRQAPPAMTRDLVIFATCLSAAGERIA